MKIIIDSETLFYFTLREKYITTYISTYDTGLNPYLQ
jgi:hypothetical protein